MENLLGKLDVLLAEKGIEVSDDLVFLINTRIKPPLPVKKEDIYIRAMYLVSDQVNSFGGCFPVDEHPRLAELLVDSPVLVGHSKEKLPIARNFKADLVEKDGANWIKVYFYWLKNSPEAESLKENIDHGIYKECSIGFSFEFPECSICKQDMRRCQHIPFRAYQTEDGHQTQAHFNYRNITKVHETSLVYRGAVSGTSITNELNLFQKHDCEDGVCKFKRVYRESIQEPLRKAGLDEEIKLAGEIAENGYTEDEIEIFCDKNSEDKILGSLPEIFRSRVRFVNGVKANLHSFQASEFVLESFSREYRKGHKIRFQNGTNSTAIQIHRLDIQKLNQGRRFLCDWSSDPAVKEDVEDAGSELDKGECRLIDKEDNFCTFRMKGNLFKGLYLVRRARLRNKEQWIFSKKPEV